MKKVTLTIKYLDLNISHDSRETQTKVFKSSNMWLLKTKFENWYDNCNAVIEDYDIDSKEHGTWGSRGINAGASLFITLRDTVEDDLRNERGRVRVRVHISIAGDPPIATMVRERLSETDADMILRHYAFTHKVKMAWLVVTSQTKFTKYRLINGKFEVAYSRPVRHEISESKAIRV